jgi:uncharacterized protein DUF4258
VSKIGQIQALVRNGLYYLTEHADDEAIDDDFDIHDVEYALLNGKIRRTRPRENKYEVVGRAFDGRPLGAVCRITNTRKVGVITVYQDRPKH